MAVLYIATHQWTHYQIGTYITYPEFSTALFAYSTYATTLDPSKTCLYASPIRTWNIRPSGE